MLARRLSFPVLFVAALAQLGFVLFYLAQEQTVPFWDYAMYADMALFWFDHGAPWAAFHQSLAQNYNLLFALPSLLSFSLFEPSRTIFIATNFVFFFLAFEGALAFLFRRLFCFSWRKALGISLLFCSAVPFLWFPLLEGYPDHAALACLTLAVALWLGKRRGWKRALGCGFLLGLTVVFRRHFAYPVLAFLVCAAFFDFFRFRFSKEAFLFSLFCGLSALGFVFFLEPSYFQEMLETDFRALYRSYERPPSYFISFLSAKAGFFLLASALAGYFFVLKKKPFPPFFFFFPLFFLFWLLLWAFGPSQAGDHYLLSAAPLFLLVGLVGLFEELPLRARVLLLLFLAANSAYALYFGPFSLPNAAPSPSLESAPRPPWRRQDKPALVALASYLAETTQPSDRIVVVGSSFLFNADLLRALYTDELKTGAVARRILATPEIDGKQPPPLDAYAAGTVFLVATPTQYHLDPSGQKVVTALAASFPPSPAFSSFFDKDRRSFSLQDGVGLDIWRRKPLPFSLLHDGLSSLRAVTDAPHLSWVVLAAAHGAEVGPSFFQALLGPQAPSARFFLDRPLSSGFFQIGFRVTWDPACPAPRLTASFWDAKNDLFEKKTGQPPQNGGLYYIAAALPRGEPFFLTLEVSSSASSPCFVALSQLPFEE